MKVKLVNRTDNPIAHHEGEIDDSVIDTASIVQRNGQLYVFSGMGFGLCAIFHEAVDTYTVTEF